MAQVASYSKAGVKQTTKVTLPKDVFTLEPNHQLLDQAYRSYLAAGRKVSATTLTRGLVRGGGRKPWRQKGTGRARFGSIRVPNWRGGGITFGPSGNENYLINMPTKAKRAAIAQALSAQAASDIVRVIDDVTSTDGKTKNMVALLAKLEVTGQILLVVPTKDAKLDQATRNIAGLKLVSASYLNVFDILNADAIIIAKPALEILEQWLGSAHKTAGAK